MNAVGLFLRVAYDVLPKGDIEQEWAEEVFKRIARGKTYKGLKKLVLGIFSIEELQNGGIHSPLMFFTCRKRRSSIRFRLRSMSLD